jgi:hypothetical protein
VLGGVTKEIGGPRVSTLALSSFATLFFDHVFFCCTLQLIIMAGSVLHSYYKIFLYPLDFQNAFYMIITNLLLFA